MFESFLLAIAPFRLFEFFIHSIAISQPEEGLFYRVSDEHVPPQYQPSERDRQSAKGFRRGPAPFPSSCARMGC